MDRPIAIVTDEDRLRRQYKGVCGVTLNNMTFKGRAERLGWIRGSVRDAGSIWAYHRRLLQAGVEFLLCLDEMYVGMDIYSDIKLQEGYFVKAGSVKIGRYVYDDPADESDPRVIPFGEVPPIAFSEIMGDLQKIVGKRKIESEEE